MDHDLFVIIWLEINVTAMVKFRLRVGTGEIYFQINHVKEYKGEDNTKKRV